MPIKVLVKKETSDKIDRFPSDLKDRIKESLKELEITWPMSRLDIKKLKGYDNHYRIRVGDYRILFFRESGTAKVYDVSHRHDVYKRKE
ncbi:MAG: type II toxin-antitoxin system RelE/ParE family toxin [Thaumarchaeota archaeon]|nr:type II toxin-antitoxin system RelE/ParE family toxin [Nitrososphaerota archaeon]MDE1873218.1 type II toxin-antitoxin system RelE/ParE family toxin [Nitrososphaerota archaeon]